MTAITERVRRKRTAAQPEELRGAQDVLARVTGLRLDFRSLEPAEGLRAVEIVRAARSAGGGLNLTTLDRGEARDLDALLERAAALAPGTLKRGREEQTQLAKVAELARRVTRLPVSRRQEESILGEVWVQISEHRALELEHLGVLLYVLAAFRAGESVGPGSRVDRDPDGPFVVFDARLGLCGYAAGDASGTMRVLGHLGKNGWVTLSRRGPQVTLRLGARARRVLKAAA